MLERGVLTIQTPRWALPLIKPSRYKGVHGGRGSGKSHERAEALVERCVAEKTDAVCIREVQKSLAQSVKKLVESKIESMGVSHLFDIQKTEIKCPHGGIIIFQGMQNHTADSIKSLEGYDIAWVEEAQSLSQRSLDLLRPTIRKTGSELWFTWNPRFAKDPVDALLRGDDPPPGAVVLEVNYTENPWFPDVLRTEMEYDRKRDPEKYAHVWLGHYQQSSEARVFKNWRVDEFEAPDGVTFRYGADFGFSVDPSCAVRCHLDGRNLYVDHEAYRIGCEIDQLPDLFMSIPDIERWPLIADTSRPETISYLRRHGFPRIQAAVKGARSVEEGIAFLQSYDIIVHPRCTHLIDELTMYRYKVDPDTDAVLPILEDKDNHLIDSLRYACEGVRRAQNAMPVQRAVAVPSMSNPLARRA